MLYLLYSDTSADNSSIDSMCGAFARHGFDFDTGLRLLGQRFPNSIPHNGAMYFKWVDIIEKVCTFYKWHI